MIRFARFLVPGALLLAALGVTSCEDTHNYSRIYAYRASSNRELPAFITGGYLKNISGLSVGSFNGRMGYALVAAIDGSTVPKGDMPSKEERISYSAGGFLLGQDIAFKNYAIAPGQHRITTEITMLNKTFTQDFTFYAQPAGNYYLTGEGGGFNARVWLMDQTTRPIVGILETMPPESQPAPPPQPVMQMQPRQVMPSQPYQQYQQMQMQPMQTYQQSPQQPSTNQPERSRHLH